MGNASGRMTKLCFHKSEIIWNTCKFIDMTLYKRQKTVSHRSWHIPKASWLPHLDIKVYKTCPYTRIWKHHHNSDLTATCHFVLLPGFTPYLCFTVLKKVYIEKKTLGKDGTEIFLGRSEGDSHKRSRRRRPCVPRALDHRRSVHHHLVPRRHCRCGYDSGCGWATGPPQRPLHRHPASALLILQQP